METPREFAESYLRQKDSNVKFFSRLAVVLLMSGGFVAIWQFYGGPGQLAVPLLLAGIACLLLDLVGIAESIVVGLDYRIEQERERTR